MAAAVAVAVAAAVAVAVAAPLAVPAQGSARMAAPVVNPFRAAELSYSLLLLLLPSAGGERSRRKRITATEVETFLFTAVFLKCHLQIETL